MAKRALEKLDKTVDRVGYWHGAWKLLSENWPTILGITTTLGTAIYAAAWSAWRYVQMIAANVSYWYFPFFAMLLLFALVGAVTSALLVRRFFTGHTVLGEVRETSPVQVEKAESTPSKRLEDAPPRLMARDLGDNWRAIYRNRRQLRLYEAACIAADIPPELPMPSGSPLAYYEELRVALEIGEIEYDFDQPPASVSLGSSIYHGKRRILEWRRDQITPDLVLPRHRIALFFISRENEEAARRLGARDTILESDSPLQSPPGIEEKTPR